MLVVDDTIGLVVDDTMSDHTMPLASCQMVDDMVAMTFMSFLYGLFHKDRVMKFVSIRSFSQR
jgi:hypothetical protein